MKSTYVLSFVFCFLLLCGCSSPDPITQLSPKTGIVDSSSVREATTSEANSDSKSNSEFSVVFQPDHEPIRWPSNTCTLVGRLHSLRPDDEKMLASFYHKETDSFTYFSISQNTEVWDTDGNVLGWDTLENGTDVVALCTRNSVTPHAISVQLLPALDLLTDAELMNIVIRPEAALMGPCSFTFTDAAELDSEELYLLSLAWMAPDQLASYWNDETKHFVFSENAICTSLDSHLRGYNLDIRKCRLYDKGADAILTPLIPDYPDSCHPRVAAKEQDGPLTTFVVEYWDENGEELQQAKSYTIQPYEGGCYFLDAQMGYGSFNQVFNPDALYVILATRFPEAAAQALTELSRFISGHSDLFQPYWVLDDIAPYATATLIQNGETTSLTFTCPETNNHINLVYLPQTGVLVNPAQ